MDRERDGHEPRVATSMQIPSTLFGQGEMNATIPQSRGNDSTKQVTEVGSSGGYGMSGLVVQFLIMYIITRDLLMTSSFLNHYVPISGTIQARGGVAPLIAWIAWSTRGFGPGFGAFR